MSVASIFVLLITAPSPGAVSMWLVRAGRFIFSSGFTSKGGCDCEAAVSAPRLIGAGLGRLERLGHMSQSLEDGLVSSEDRHPRVGLGDLAIE